MSSSTKRKHVFNELLTSELRVPNDKEVLCRVIASRGNNLHEVETSEDEVFLASMPKKFRLNVWVKCGDFVLLERIDEGTKVKGEIVSVLTRDHIKYYKSEGVWPDKFNDVSTNQIESNGDNGESEMGEGDSGHLNERNTYSDSDSSESSSDDDVCNNR